MQWENTKVESEKSHDEDSKTSTLSDYTDDEERNTNMIVETEEEIKKDFIKKKRNRRINKKCK